MSQRFDADALDEVISAHQSQGLWADLRPAHAHRGARPGDRRRQSTPATSMSTATRSAPSSARSHSAARGFRAPVRKPAARIICGASARPAGGRPEDRRRRPASDARPHSAAIAGPGARRLVAPSGAHRHPAQASARQGRCSDRSSGRARFRPGRSARPDRRGQRADASPARPGAGLGPDRDTLLAQVVQALAAGNAVLAVAPDAPRRARGR